MKKIILIFLNIFIVPVFFLFASSHFAVAATPCGSTTTDPKTCETNCPAILFKSNVANNINLYICTNPSTNTNSTTEGDGSICNPVLDALVGGCKNTVAGEDIIARILAAVIRIFFIIGALAVLIYLMLGGLQWITAGGDKSKLENARNHLTSAFIGIVIIAATYAIMVFLGDLLGIPFFKSLKIDWPTIGS